MPKIHYGVDTDQPKGVFYDRIVDSEHYTSHASAEAWANYLRPFVKSTGLDQADLIIEGGIGTNHLMAHVSRELFPQAIYIGTDISEAFVDRFGRVRGRIDDPTLERVERANGPKFNPLEASVAANCLDANIINDIKRKTGSSFPILVSYNALVALADKKATPWERKHEDDRIALEHALSTTPYQAQLHVNGIDFAGFWSSESQWQGTIFTETFSRLEKAGKAMGWMTQQLPMGLLVTRK